MLPSRVIPVLLLKNSGLVKTTRFKNPRYVGDPLNAVRIFNDKEVDELVFLDIEASTVRSEPKYEFIKDIATECFMPFAYGGGIRSLEQVKKVLELGAEKVVINTATIENPEVVTQAAQYAGSQAIVGSIDVKRTLLGGYSVFLRSGTVNSREDPVAHAVKLEKLGVGEIVINSIDRDGTFKGYDLQLVRRVADAVTIPVIALGGAGSVADFERALGEGRASAVAAGSIFVFYGKHKAVLINYPKLSQEGKICVN